MANLSNIITPTNVLTASSTNTLTNKTISGASNTITNIPMSSAVTGTLPVANGGTGAASLTANNVLLGNGTSAVQVVAPGSSGNVLTSDGTTWQSTAPAAAGGTITATATGSISAGAPVVINADGTVSVGAATYSGTWSVTSGTASTGATGIGGNMSATYDPNANAIVVFYGSTNNAYPTVVVGLISGSTITWGTPTVVYSSGTATPSYGSKSIYASTANAHLYFQSGSDGYLRYSSVRISSTGAVTVIQSISTIDYYTVNGGPEKSSFLYDPATNRLAYFFPNYNTNYTVLVGGTCNTSGFFTYAYSYQVDTSGTTSNGPAAAYFDTSASIGVLFWQNDTNYLWTQTVTLANASASFGALVQVTNFNNLGYSIAVGPQATGGGGLLYSYIPNSGSAMQFRAATRSGTSITLGSISAAANYGFYAYTNSQFITYGGRTIWVNNSLAYTVTVSGGVPSATNIGSNSGQNNNPQNFIQNTNDLTLIQVSRFSTSQISSWYYSDATTNITSSNFIGFSSSSYTNGQTATINTVGSSNSSQSSLTAGLKYYVTIAGALSSSGTSQPYAGVALSATRILVKG